MRIISNFRDYYDGVQRSFQGTGEQWLRQSPFTGSDRDLVGDIDEQRCLTLEHPLVAEECYESKGVDRAKWYVLGFCGEIHFVLTDVHRKDRDPIYSLEEWKKRRKELLKTGEVSSWTERDVEKYFNQSPSEELKELFYKYRTPLFLVKRTEWYYDWRHQLEHTQDPYRGQRQALFINTVHLESLKWPKRMDAFTCYQEILMYMGSMAHPEPHMVQISDKDQIDKKGFDQRWSFRHRTGKNT